MMKTKNSLVAMLAVLVFGSCIRHPSQPEGRSVLYNNETHIDTEGYVFLKLVHEKAQFETQLAKYVQGSTASSDAKALAAKIIEVYQPITEELENLAPETYVVLPDPGMPGFSVPHHFNTDTLGNFSSDGYITHVQHEQAAILEQLSRIDRNTNKKLRHYAQEKLPVVKALYAAAGGEEDHAGHH